MPYTSFLFAHAYIQKRIVNVFSLRMRIEGKSSIQIGAEVWACSKAYEQRLERKNRPGRRILGVTVLAFSWSSSEIREETNEVGENLSMTGIV